MENKIKEYFKGKEDDVLETITMLLEDQENIKFIK